jgi:hypothetical protein
MIDYPMIKGRESCAFLTLSAESKSALDLICKRFDAGLNVVTSRSVHLLSFPSDKTYETP